MRRREKLPELLSPAGSKEALIAAVRAGADAVYVGGKSFGARAFAKNFDNDELAFAVRYCHLHGVRLYVTVNTLVNDKELESLSDYAAYLYEIGVDAVICADLGAIREMRRRAPDLEIHASTQMSVHNVSGAKMAHELGCTRVVPARELSLENIKTMVENTPTEIEIFLHGALCVCHSGQCLFSSLVGGRSGNRGECAQPCRLPYNGGKYPLSLKDLSLAEHIPTIIESGVSSLKIEGRMKSPEYVYAVTKIYRTLLDEGRGATKGEMRRLAEIFSRDGFTDGYFKGELAKGMTGVRTDTDKVASRALESAPTEPERVRVFARVRMTLGEPSEMTLYNDARSVTVTGATATRAINAPLSPEDVKARLSKMGNTLLSLSPEDIELILDEGVNIPPSMINALRRDAAEKFESAKRPAPDTVYEGRVKGRRAKKMRTAEIFDKDVYLALKRSGEIDKFDVAFLSLEAAAALDAAPRGVAIPPVVLDSEWSEVCDMLIKLRDGGCEYALVSNIGAIELAREAGLMPIGGFRLNVTNSGTRLTYSDFGVEHIVLSPELTLPQARDIGGGVIVAGRIPLMLTERCFIKDTAGCSECGKSSLTDRTGARFPMRREFGHRNLIFNSMPTYMGDKKGELASANVVHEHFIISTESERQAEEMIDSYFASRPLRGDVRRIGRR